MSVPSCLLILTRQPFLPAIIAAVSTLLVWHGLPLETSPLLHALLAVLLGVLLALLAMRFVRASYQQAAFAGSEVPLRLASLDQGNALRAIFETSNAGIFLTEADGRVILVNARLTEMFRASAGGLVGRYYWDLVHTDSRQEARMLYEKLMDGVISSSDVRRHYLRDDGSSFWALISGRRRTDLRGRGAGLTGVIIDVSDRQRIEEALLRSEERFRLMVGNASDMLAQFDRYGALNYLSPVVEKMTGYSAEDLLRTQQRYYSDEDRQIVADAMHRLLAEPGREIRYEYRHIHRTRGFLWIEALARNFLGNDALGSIIVNERDISRRKAVERELSEARETAEKAARAKGDFLANMSHEIRTPMNAVIGLAYLLERTPLEARQRDYIDKLKGAVRALQGMVNHILDFSRVESGQVQLAPADFSLDEVIDDLACICGVNIGDKPVEILFEVSEALPPVLHGDPFRLEQVLTNLLGNAIKFTARGEVRLTVEPLTGAADGRIRLRFGVHDTGIGIHALQQQQLFDPFVQASAETSRQFGGTGLGLAISRRLARLMGGDITVYSRPGVGSSFTFEAVFAEAVSETAAPSVLAGRHFLCAIASSAGARIAARLLTGAGARVHQVSTLEAAESWLSRAIPVDFVVMDSLLVTEDAALARAASAAAQRHAALFLLAAAADRHHQAMTSEWSPVAGFLLKPLTRHALVDAVARHLTPPPEPLSAADPASPGPLQGCRVLVADDNPLNQQVIAEILASFGVDVALVGNGREVLAHLADPGGIDVVLMDLQMPLMDGLAATRALRADPRWANLPVIALTASSEAAALASCLAAGANDYIAKPVEVEVLYASLLRAMGRQAATLSAVVQSPVALPNWPGINFNEALPRVLGNIELLARLLEMALARYGDSPERIEDLMSIGDFEAAAQLAHDLTGVAAAIGAHKLLLASRALQVLLGQPGETAALDCAVAEVRGALAELKSGRAGGDDRP